MFCMFLLYDLTHLFKNIYNTWIIEKMQKLRYSDPDSKDTKIVSSAHIKEIYFDKQKVRLCMNVFNEKVVAQL